MTTSYGVVVVVERAPSDQVLAGLAQLDAVRLHERDQRHLLLQPLDLRLGDLRHAASEKFLLSPRVATGYAM